VAAAAAPSKAAESIGRFTTGHKARGHPSASICLDFFLPLTPAVPFFLSVIADTISAERNLFIAGRASALVIAPRSLSELSRGEIQETARKLAARRDERLQDERGARDRLAVVISVFEYACWRLCDCRWQVRRSKGLIDGKTDSCWSGNFISLVATRKCLSFNNDSRHATSDDLPDDS